jgi:hypothetical protein
VYQSSLLDRKKLINNISEEDKNDDQDSITNILSSGTININKKLTFGNKFNPIMNFLKKTRKQYNLQSD